MVNKEWMFSLYNAVNGTAHTDPNDITINTIDDMVYLGMKNEWRSLHKANFGGRNGCVANPG